MVHWMTGGTWLLPSPTHRTGHQGNFPQSSLISPHCFPCNVTAFPGSSPTRLADNGPLTCFAQGLLFSLLLFEPTSSDGGTACQPETNCSCNWRSKPTLCHMDSWPTVGECISHRLHNYTQHVVKDGIDLDTKNPSPHFDPPNLLDNRQALFHLLPRADRTQMAQMASKNRLWWPKWCVLKLIYSYPMSGLLMFVFLHVPSKTTTCCCAFYPFTMDLIIQSSKSTSWWGQIGSPWSPRPPNLFKFEHWNLVDLSTAPKHRLFPNCTTCIAAVNSSIFHQPEMSSSTIILYKYVRNIYIYNKYNIVTVYIYIRMYIQNNHLV